MSGSGILGISIGLNAVSTHGACTAVFVAIAAILGFIFSSVRTLGRITWLAWIGLPCILTAGELAKLLHKSPPLLLTYSSPDRDRCCRYPRSTRRCASDRYTLALRFQDRRQPIIHRGDHGCFQPRICILRYPGLLLDCV